MTSLVLPAPFTILVLLMSAAALIGLLWRRQARLPAPTIRAIEAHFSREGRVIAIRPALMGFGNSPPGARQYSIEVVTRAGQSHGHTIEVDRAGRVRTML